MDVILKIDIIFNINIQYYKRREFNDFFVHRTVREIVIVFDSQIPPLVKLRSLWANFRVNLWLNFWTGVILLQCPKLYKAQNINLYWDSRTTRSNFGPRNILWEPLSCDAGFLCFRKWAWSLKWRFPIWWEKIKDSDEVEVCKTNLIKFKNEPRT